MQVFKPKLDDRYSASQVASHDGGHAEAEVIESAAEILEKLAPQTTVVAIDEAQFFDWGVADVARLLADRGLRVIITGLDLDFRGEPFGPMPLLMAEAEMVDKLHAICVVCAAPACRTQRLINGQPARYTDPVILVSMSRGAAALPRTSARTREAGRAGTLGGRLARTGLKHK